MLLGAGCLYQDAKTREQVCRFVWGVKNPGMLPRTVVHFLTGVDAGALPAISLCSGTLTLPFYDSFEQFKSKLDFCASLGHYEVQLL